RVVTGVIDGIALSIGGGIDAVADVASILIAHQAADEITSTFHAARGIGMLDAAITMLSAQPPGIVITSTFDAAQAIGMLDAATPLLAHQATNIPISRHAAANQPDIAQGGVAGATKQAHVILAGAVDDQTINTMTQAVEGTGEAI